MHDVMTQQCLEVNGTRCYRMAGGTICKAVFSGIHIFALICRLTFVMNCIQNANSQLSSGSSGMIRQRDGEKTPYPVESMCPIHSKYESNALWLTSL